jgi:integrase
MDEARKNRDFSKGPVWDPRTDRWLVEIRYPDGRRCRKRFRRERQALRLWSTEQMKIENGTWHEQTAKIVVLGMALAQYREYSKVQNRSHNTYIEPVLKMWERKLDTKQLLARVSPKQIDAVKQCRVEDVERTTVDKDLGVLKAFFNWCVDRGMAATNPVCKVKFFNVSNERVRYLQDEEWERLQLAALKVEPRSPYLVDKMVLARNTGLRRTNLFRAEWEWVDWLNRVVRVPKTKNNRAYAVPLNDTAHEIMKRLYAARDVELASPHIFVHPRGTRHAGKPVLDVKNAFATALEDAGIRNFKWHDFRHDYASRLVMAGVSLRAVAELLGHKGLRMVMRYAHLAPGYLSDEVRKLDTFKLVDRSTERARKGQGRSKGYQREAKVARFVRENGSSGWTRTSNPPVNSRMLCH